MAKKPTKKRPASRVATSRSSSNRTTRGQLVEVDHAPLRAQRRWNWANLVFSGLAAFAAVVGVLVSYSVGRSGPTQPPILEAESFGDLQVQAVGTDLESGFYQAIVLTSQRNLPPLVVGIQASFALEGSKWVDVDFATGPGCNREPFTVNQAVVVVFPVPTVGDTTYLSGKIKVLTANQEVATINVVPGGSAPKLLSDQARSIVDTCSLAAD